MEFFEAVVLGKPAWMWGLFGLVVLILLAFDLGLLHRKPKPIEVRESLFLSAFYIAVALAYGAWIWMTLGAQSGEEYFTGYLVEKTLSLDNIFVISLIFTYFAIPESYQHRVLFWGILGVVVLRAIMIAAGAALVSEFEWVLYLFAAFLIATGVKMLTLGDKPPQIENNIVLKALKRIMRITPELDGQRFFVRRPHPNSGAVVTWATPLFVALLLIEIVDLIFAVDSVPAIFAITTDPFIVYTSNIFAILGLRALYFALSAVIARFVYLKQALALVLIFIGGKVFAADIAGIDKIPASVSLSVTIALIGGGVAYSLWRTRRDGETQRLASG